MLSVRQHSGDESPDLSHPNKENDKPVDSRDAKDGRLLSSDGSVDSGVDTDVSLILCQLHVNVFNQIIQLITYIHVHNLYLNTIIFKAIKACGVLY